MPRVIHFEIHAEDPERAVAFYQSVFGWTARKWEGPADYWLLTTGDAAAPGINGGLLHRRGPGPSDGAPVSGFVCTVDVPSVDDYTARATAAGGTIALPKMAVPGVGWLAYFKDTEGNIVGMMQAAPAAA